MWMYLLIMGVCLCVGMYRYSKWKYGYFERKRIRYVEPPYPLMGSMATVLLRKEHFLHYVLKMYNMFPEEKYIGHYDFLSPTIFLRDIDVIKQIAVKDFDHFTDHRNFVKDSNDTISSRHLFVLEGQEWKDMRATLSPAFTASKMRSMFGLVVECAKKQAQYYLELAKETSNGAPLEIEMKDSFTRYTNDVIATCAFGVEVDSLQDKDNEFFTMGKKASQATTFQIFKFIIYSMMPKLMKALDISIADPDLLAFLRRLVQGAMRERDRMGLVRPDMIQLLMDAKKGILKVKDEDRKAGKNEEAGFATVQESQVGEETVKRKWTDDELTAQAFLFFVAGFETTSVLLCFLCHELLKNPDIQDKLHEEIDEVKAGLDGDLQYNDLTKLKYMDMVISETLRFWPPGPATDRVCVKPYTLPPASDGRPSYQVNVGDTLFIPIRGLHFDPVNFPEPEKFDPERFSEDNKHNIKPYSYLPFGIGPRNCIGSRFALMEAKAVLFYLLSNFELTVIEKTEIPIKLANNAMTMNAENGFWMGLKPRPQNKT